MVSMIGGANQVPLVRYNPSMMTILRLEPSTGNKVGGMAGGGFRFLKANTALSTTLKDPAVNTNNMRCQFGSSNFQVTPDAAVIKSGIIQCLPPAHDAGTVPVGFTLDGNVWINGTAYYTFLCEPNQFIDSSKPSQLQCQPCGVNGNSDMMRCDGSYHFQPKVGFWRPSYQTLNSTIYKCPFPESCLGANGTSTSNLCFKGHKGLLCAICLRLRVPHYINRPGDHRPST